MNKFDKKIRQIAAEEKIDTPESVKSRVEETLNLLPQKSESKIIKFKYAAKTAGKILASAACIAFVFIVLAPNISVGYAQKMENVPVLGDIVKVVTIRNYIYKDGEQEIDMAVPEIDPAEGEAAQNINMSVTELTEKILKEFNAELKEYEGDSHTTTSVDYEVLRNDSDWFTLKLTVLHIAASSDTEYEYYHIDRHTGKIIYLEDLFKNSSYAKRIEDEVKRQMIRQMKKDENIIYWTQKEDFGEDFTKISPHHSFYFDESGNIVIVYDKYDVAPGYMGCPEFTIKKDSLKDILKDEYKK